MDHQKPCLLLIDFQEGFHDPSWGKRNNPHLEENALSILEKWRELSWPIIHIQHASPDMNSPLHPSSPGHDFMYGFAPLSNEKMITKNVNSAFIGTELDLFLTKERIESLCIIGLTTNHCVSTTTRMAANLGYDVTLISDATACFERYSFDKSLYSAEAIHTFSLLNLHQEFARILSTDEIHEEIQQVIQSIMRRN